MHFLILGPLENQSQERLSLANTAVILQLFQFLLQINRKWKLCLEFLDVFGRVDPGLTDWRAITQFEAVQARSFLLQLDLEAGKIPATVFKSALMSECKVSTCKVFLLLLSAATTLVEDLILKTCLYVVTFLHCKNHDIYLM